MWVSEFSIIIFLSVEFLAFSSMRFTAAIWFYISPFKYFKQTAIELGIIRLIDIYECVFVWSKNTCIFLSVYRRIFPVDIIHRLLLAFCSQLSRLPVYFWLVMCCFILYDYFSLSLLYEVYGDVLSPDLLVHRFCLFSPYYVSTVCAGWSTRRGDPTCLWSLICLVVAGLSMAPVRV